MKNTNRILKFPLLTLKAESKAKIICQIGPKSSNPFSRNFDSSYQAAHIQYVLFTSTVDQFSDLGQGWVITIG